MVQKLKSLSQLQLAHDVVVAGSVRTDLRQAQQTPASVLSERLPIADTDRFNPNGYPASGIARSGLRAGRSVGARGSLLSRRISGQTGATCRTWGAYQSSAGQRLTTNARRVPVSLAAWCSGRMCQEPAMAKRLEPRARPAM